MPTDLEIARTARCLPIADVGRALGLADTDLEPYGRDKAKLTPEAVSKALGSSHRGKLIVVTAITPTPAGEGKTTVTIGLAQGLAKIGQRAAAAIREPSMGPVFGMKGGAAGGGYSQVVPMEDINLHFTGDFHAIGAANNLLCAMIDNHLYQGNVLDIDSRTITYRRCMDMNDRALRQVVLGLGGSANGYPREGGFSITVASEVMAILCLSESPEELKERLSRIVFGQSRSGVPLTAGDLGAHGAMAVLLKDAIKPNLVQTIEGVPAFVHGGPFGNIAHGCSSVVATRTALGLTDYVVTEAGFGSDLGFEKFCDIVAAPRLPELAPNAAVLVATVRALKMHGGVSKTRLTRENVRAVSLGLCNLKRHADIVTRSGLPFVVAVNRFLSDTDAEVAVVKAFCRENGWACEECDVWGRGGDGAADLARAVVTAVANREPAQLHPFYDAESTLVDKLDSLAKNVYGADSVALSADAKKQLLWLCDHGFDKLPVCVAKTQYSFTDNALQRGAPTGFSLTVRALSLSAGAGFVVALIGDIMTMPGLPKHPAAMDIDINSGVITGLF